MNQNSLDFLTKLQKEANLQAKLEKRKFLPSQLDGLASLIINHNLQFLLIVSFVSALVWQLLDL